tara:strand:+ start:321 stop:1322 length:1002 start_codon:yes stop_codon:yes gene_type:complete
MVRFAADRRAAQGEAMSTHSPIKAVYLSETLDLQALYGSALGAHEADVIADLPEAISAPEEVRLAICWLPGQADFARYPNLEVVMSIGAGVDALLANPGIPSELQIARVRDPHQAALMAGFAAHEVLLRTRDFAALAESAARAEWTPLPMQAPEETVVAVLGDGTMGRAVSNALHHLGFTVHIARRSAPNDPHPGCQYFTGPQASAAAAKGAHFLINVLPLTPETENVLNSALFAQLAPGAWLIQIGRGQHLVEEDLSAALETGQLAGATLDVFRQEPLPPEHPFWHDPRLRITPHIASDSLPGVVAAQIAQTAREIGEGTPLTLGVSRDQGY